MKYLLLEFFISKNKDMNKFIAIREYYKKYNKKSDVIIWNSKSGLISNLPNS